MTIKNDLRLAVQATLDNYLYSIFPSVRPSSFQLGHIVHASDDFFNITLVLPPAFPSISWLKHSCGFNITIFEYFVLLHVNKYRIKMSLIHIHLKHQDHPFSVSTYDQHRNHAQFYGRRSSRIMSSASHSWRRSSAHIDCLEPL